MLTLTKTFSLILIVSIISCSKKQDDKKITDNDGRITITSTNEPNSDTDALAILKIKMAPLPKVLVREYEAGLDDNMKLVIELPSDQLQLFKDSIKWSDSLVPSKGVKLPVHSNKIWSSHTISKAGLYGTYSLPNSEYVRVYIADDLSADSKRVFLFWHQT